MTNCINCNKQYEPKRTTSKYCSDACRVAGNRVSVTKDSVTNSENVTIKVSVTKFVNHLTGEEHEITEVSKRTGLNYDLNERSEKLGLKKHRCSGCGEPTWFGCAECGKEGGIKE